MRVTISPKHPVVVHKDIRRRLNLRPGQRVHAIARGESMVFVPVLPIERLRGLLRSINTDVEPEDDPA